MFGKKYIWGVTSPDEGNEFVGWEHFIEWETARRERVKRGESGVPDGVDAAIICTLDQTHREIIEGLAPLSLHILCEKPLATTLDDCIHIYASLLSGRPTLFAIGHVLRYMPLGVLLRKLIWEDGAIGDIVSMQHIEEVGWWHFAHSYVRGNWRKQSTSGPSLLTKCCHDIDFLFWLLSPSSPGETLHLPTTISSSGSVMYFKPSRKPKLAGTATNCLSCAAERDCPYSAKKQYIDRGIMDDKMGWPVDVVVPDIEQHFEHGLEYAQSKVLDRLAEDYTVNHDQQTIDSRGWYGRCVYESDNDVCDDQFVTISWEDDFLDEKTNRDGRPRSRGAKTATLHMTAFSNPISISQRHTRIFGTQGEITADSDSITVRSYDPAQITTHHLPSTHGGHNGGDEGLIRAFVLGVDAVKNHGMTVSEAQKTHIGSSIEEVIRSHALIFAAEEARLGKKVLNWKQWWEEVVEAKLRTLKSQPMQNL